MDTKGLSETERHIWMKSSYSGAEGGQCVEVVTSQQAVLVRDSKNADGPILTLSPRAWNGLVELASSARTS